MNKLCFSTANKVFAWFIRERQRSIPPWRDTFETNYPSRDGLVLRGWAHRPHGAAAGTLFLLHGYSVHSGLENYWNLAKYLSAKHSVVVCAVDFRHHGLSDNAPPTFGEAESWDVCATLDEAEKHASPKPFILLGDSLGGMAAQRAAIQDSRVAAAVMLHPPACPWHAVEKCIPTSVVSRPAGLLINQAYGRDMLGAGDIRKYDAHPAHRPRILYLMGTKDRYDIQETRRVYDHWYKGVSATWNVWPTAAPEERKWFVEVEGAEHPDRPNVYTISDWPEFSAVLDGFINLVLCSTRKR